MKDLYVFDKPLVISKEREAYNHYRLMFIAEADAAKSRFSNLYKNCHSLDNVITYVPKYTAECIDSVIAKCIKILLSHNVITIDEALFRERYAGFNDIWGESFLEVYDQYAEIVMDQKSLDEYRVRRRQHRSRWQGGGFGIGGAIKGAATAGTLNLISGAGHMVFNGLGKIVSSISASIQKDKIFHNPNTYETLAQGVWNASFFLHVALIDSLNITGADPLPFAGMVSEDDTRTAMAILNNAKISRSGAQRNDAMLQAFMLNPYQEEWYHYALKINGDKKGQLSDLEQYFGLSVVKKEKERQLEVFAQSLPLNTEEEALKAALEIKKLKEKLYYVGETTSTKVIFDAVERFDTEYRTVDGLALSSREEADIARSELVKIEAIEENVDYQNLASIAEAEKEISSYTTLVAQRHQQAMHELWVSLDKKQRTVDTLLPSGKPITCRTAKKAAELRPIVQQLQSELLSCVGGSDPETALLRFRAQLSEKDLPASLLKQYNAEVDRRLAEIDLKLRMVLGKEYTTRDEARTAKGLYDKIKADFVSGDPRHNGNSIRQAIENADFSEETKSALLAELFLFENAKEIKTAKTFSTLSSVIILVLVIVSFFFKLTATADFAYRDITVRGVSLLVKDVQIIDNLGFKDGFKNGVFVFGKCVGAIFVDGFHEYINGFGHGLIGNTLWAILGLFWVVIKNFFIFIPRYIVSLIVTLFQSGPITYHIGYVIGSAIPIAVSQLNFDEDDPEANVIRIKRWTKKKIFLTILVVLIVAAITLFFIRKDG